MEQNSVYIGLTNPKSPSNVGAVMRASGCFGVDEVIYTGNRYDKAVRLKTDTNKASQKISLRNVETLLDHEGGNLSIVCVDLIEGATPLTEFKHPQNAIYIFGPEDGTIAQSVVDKADHTVYIPTKGCLNLAATVNILLYDRLAKSKSHVTDNDLIRKSRDNNNNVKVRLK